uniref:Uncharacterized protein n=1 Tax=Klebsiella pneumoniae TaxID=573 RepID=A0A809T4P9_KLEPN|nr:hypothetical protein [Klebsiella pneumoniae]
MRNGKILGWAWGAGFVDGLVRAWNGLHSRLLAWGQPHLLAPVTF